MSQRGNTLLEWIVTLAIIAMVVVAGGAFAQATHPYALHAAVVRVKSLLATARSVASTSGNGATVTFVPSGTQTVITLYAGRPDGGTFGIVVTTDTIDGGVTSAGVNGTPVALFIDSADSGTAAAWSTTSGTIANEPACPGALDLTFSVGAGHETHALSCTDMILQ